MLARTDSGPGPLTALHGCAVRLDPRGGLFWPDEHLLVVADLHLEKGSAFARRGQMLPPYDTAETLARLEALVAALAPRRIVALGDSFHDRWGAERLPDEARRRLRALAAGRDFLWIAGNHDPEPNGELEGDWAREARIGPLVLRHEPAEVPEPGEVAGHLHPVARLSVRGRSIRRRCFATDGRRLVLPALGAYAGGLNVRHGAVAGLFAGPFEAHLLGAARTYRIASTACLGE
ncbi:ligase-associated DNA damage response endonuclease PdeM [Azorhizobium doebereinerae]|uniref:ligase-associated DNA damage response endonuclease PdeM n=1 Tax=Azorhizobium doebereinerae TaxID=281091 RepID=UPI000413D5E8|nr:ligase-associated DNA damage response endonuclease PdeM [Azorhizobium doebereinerae]